MKRYTLISFSLLALVAVAPVQAKKPGGDEQLPQGLQKKVQRGGQLPPGWQKRLKKGEVLEPEVVSHGQPVSSKVRVQLPLGDKGSIDISLDGKVIRLDERSRRVLDVFEVRM